MVLLALLGGCVEPSGSTTQPRSTVGINVEGEVLSPLSAANLGVPDKAEFVPGQALVKYKNTPHSSEGVRGFAVRKVGDFELIQQPALSVQSAVGVQATSVLGQATLNWIAQLRSRDDLEFVEPNYLRYPQATPNDLLYSDKIKPRFAQINLEKAWDITTGSANVAVAILDDGILWRSGDSKATHPDLACGRVLPGYDFVSSASNGDGTGRDDDPYQTPGSDHGSHVAGTIGACSNNSLGVSGVDWKAKLLPVRVLGQVGTDADIIDGLRWAAGLKVSGVADNPTPAKVINMSLGGFGISQAFDQAINEVTDHGAIVVVAAGNDNQDALLYAPAGNERVITVGAAKPDGSRADFSNYGPGIEVMAPGTGIYSTTSDGSGFGYKAFSGTSMASPHVAGVVALMAAVKPDLRWYEAFEYLTKTAVAIPGCKVCGAGLVNAAAAVLKAQQHPSIGGFITPSQQFSLSSPNQSLTLHNYGTATLNFSAQPHPYLSLSPSSGSLSPGQSLLATLHLSPPTTPSIYYSNLEVSDNNQHKANLLAFYQVGSGARDMGQVKLALCQDVGSGSKLVTSTSLSYLNNRYSFKLPADHLTGQSYYLRAWVDANNDNLTEMVSYRHYLSLTGNPISNIYVLLTGEHWQLGEQGCVAQ